MAQKSNPLQKIISDNRKARFEYEIIDSFEAGIELQGTEVKSLRVGKTSIADSYVSYEQGDLMLINAHIPHYLQANRFNHEERRPRRLLMHRREIERLAKSVDREGMTLIPLKMYFNAKGRAKVKVALCRGKKLHDKRETEKKRDWDRQKARLLRDRG